MTDHPKAARRFEDSELYEALRVVAKEVGHPPTTAEYREHRTGEMPTDATIQNRHDNSERPWLSALTEAGLEPDPANHGGVPADTGRVVYVLNELRNQLGHWPSPDEYRDVGALPSVPTIYDRYGSWPDAIDVAESMGPSTAKAKYTIEDCLNAIQAYADMTEGSPSSPGYQEWAERRPSMPSLSTILHKFGSWSDATKEAGIPPHPQGKDRYSESEVVSAVRDAIEHESSYLTYEMYCEWAKGSSTYPSGATVYRYFDSWRDAHEAAKQSDEE